MLFVSELAGAIGRNKYKSIEEATVEIWRRVNKRSYDEAIRRNQAQDWEDEAVVSSLDLNLDDAVDQESEVKATETVEQIVQRPIAPATEDDVAKVHKILERADLLPEQKETILVKQVIERVKGPLNTTVLAAVTQQVTTLAASKGEETTSQITSLLNLPKIADCEKAARCVKAVVNKRRGTKNEDKGIKAYEKAMGQKTFGHNSKFYKTNIGTVDEPCWIGGRVDGLTHDKVIEVKCRRNRLFKWLPAYEKVQTQAYMHLTNRKKCDLVQKYNGQTKTTTYNFDLEYWEEIKEEIRDFQDDLYLILMNKDAQDELLEEIS